MHIEVVFIALISTNIAVHIGLILLWKFNFKSSENTQVEFPSISVLIACRNEEANIHKLVRSLNQLNYPKEKLEILIGNDNSEDDSYALLKNLVSKNVKIFDIKETTNDLKGKMNVLAQLVSKSIGDMIYITDADMTFHPNLLNKLLSNWSEETGLIIGFTKVKQFNFFSALQNVDYTIGQSIMKVLLDMRKPLFASGNNMLVSRKAYKATGGYENMHFHTTEDVLLMKQIVKQGYQVKAVFANDSVALTKPMNGYLSLIKQRKRWMKGFSLMPFWVKPLSIFRLLYLPCIVLLLAKTPILGIFFLFLKILLNIIFSSLVNRKVGESENFIAVFWYEFYEFFIYLPALVLYFFSNKNNWKGRKL